MNRIVSPLPAGAFQTYGVAAPRRTHTRVATCVEVGCGAYLRGWRTLVDPGTELGRRQAGYIERQSGRRWLVEVLPSGIRQYTFEAGQKCFAGHRVSLEREPILTIRKGDWRVTSELRVMNGDDWLDHFATNQDRLKTMVERG